MADTPLVLIIEDEAPVRSFLRTALTTHDYRVAEAGTAREGLAQLTGRQPDVVLLDLGLPDEDGIAVLRRLREWSRTPVIVISARGREDDKVVALDTGADDYLTKPFSVVELLARIRVALRHAASAPGGDPVFAAGDLSVDLVLRTVSVKGAEVHLTPTEFKLLAALVKYPGRVLTHRQLLHEVWGAHTVAQVSALRVYMNQLRHKIEAEPAHPRRVITEPGVGYRLREADP
ncbi:MAG TPA: response regulator [Gemmatimonadales bacterium]